MQNGGEVLEECLDPADDGEPHKAPGHRSERGDDLRYHESPDRELDEQRVDDLDERLYHVAHETEGVADRAEVDLEHLECVVGPRRLLLESVHEAHLAGPVVDLAYPVVDVVQLLLESLEEAALGVTGHLAHVILEGRAESRPRLVHLLLHAAEALFDTREKCWDTNLGGDTCRLGELLRLRDRLADGISEHLPRRDTGHGEFAHLSGGYLAL